MATNQPQAFTTFNVPEGKPIRAWIEGVALEDEAKKQLENLARMPFIHRGIAVMPDVHAGKGSTVGSVIATRGAIIPAAVAPGSSPKTRSSRTISQVWCTQECQS